MKINLSSDWQKYLFEFACIFVAVVSAFTLNNWNDHKNSRNAEDKILKEIRSGLVKDLKDVDDNIRGHELGIKAINYFRDAIANKPIANDSFRMYYFTLTRDFISIQNTSGYETLKSRGLELIQDDTLRTDIISLYEYEYNTIRKLEEEYHENQFQENYFHPINNILSKSFTINEKFKVSGLELPLKISKDEETLLLSYLWKIEMNRNFTKENYHQTRLKIVRLMEKIAL